MMFPFVQRSQQLRELSSGMISAVKFLGFSREKFLHVPICVLVGWAGVR